MSRLLPQEDTSFEEGVAPLVEPLCIDKEDFEQARHDNTILEGVKGYMVSSWLMRKLISKEVQAYFTVQEELSVLNGLLLLGERLVVPQSLSHQVVAIAHEMHPEIVQTKAQLQQWFWWPGMDQQVESAIQTELQRMPKCR